MRVIAGADDNSLLLRGVAIPFEVAIDGLGAAEMRRILAGHGSGAHWTARERSLRLAAACPPAEPAGPDYRRGFADGAVALRSGGAGTLRIGPDKRPGDYLLPQSLNLALAQQWARLGVIALHGAVIAVGERRILALGPKASGKSVLCLATLAGGGQVLSDDWVLLGTDASQRPVCERLRRFLMIRDSWASAQLRTRLPELAFRRSGARPKAVLPIQADGPPFPHSLAIDQIWVLGRARTGRNSASLKRPEAPTAALSQLITAAMPLLFSARFPHEHRALLQTARCLLNACPAYRVQTGTDLVEDPAATLARLCAHDQHAAGPRGSGKRQAHS